MQGYAERWLQKFPYKAVSYKVSIKGNVEQLLLNIILLAIKTLIIIRLPPERKMSSASGFDLDNIQGDIWSVLSESHRKHSC